jgi:hypothetical protein
MITSNPISPYPVPAMAIIGSLPAWWDALYSQPTEERNSWERARRVKLALRLLDNHRQRLSGLVRRGFKYRTIERARKDLPTEGIHYNRGKERIGEKAYDALPEADKRKWFVGLPVERPVATQPSDKLPVPRPSWTGKTANFSYFPTAPMWRTREGAAGASRAHPRRGAPAQPRSRGRSRGDHPPARVPPGPG